VSLACAIYGGQTDLTAGSSRHVISLLPMSAVPSGRTNSGLIESTPVTAAADSSETLLIVLPLTSTPPLSLILLLLLLLLTDKRIHVYLE